LDVTLATAFLLLAHLMVSFFAVFFTFRVALLPTVSVSFVLLKAGFAAAEAGTAAVVSTIAAASAPHKIFL
jgi:hypothetical protein